MGFQSEYETLFNMLLGIEFKRQRLSRSITTEDLSCRTDLDAKYLEDFENGLRTIDAVDLYKLCSFMDISLNDMYDYAFQEIDLLGYFFIQPIYNA